MFAEFEDMAHKKRRRSLTAESLCSIYRQLNADYFGPAMTVDRQIDYEWERIPHFLYTFMYISMPRILSSRGHQRRIMSGNQARWKGIRSS